jgi:hypothetical protein
VKDETIERLGLISIIIGLATLFYLVLDYEYVDAFYVEEDERAYYEGFIVEKRFNEDTGWLYLEVEACKSIKAFKEGDIPKDVGDNALIRGSFKNGFFSVEDIR